MNQLKNMTIVCNEIIRAKALYIKSRFTDKNKYVIYENSEIKSSEIKSLDIGNTCILKTEKLDTPKDVIGFLKLKKINAIVLDNSIDMFEEKYLIFDTLNELIEHIIEKQKNYELFEETIEKIGLKYEEDQLNNNLNTDQMIKLSELYQDKKILTNSAHDKFVF